LIDVDREQVGEELLGERVLRDQRVREQRAVCRVAIAGACRVHGHLLVGGNVAYEPLLVGGECRHTGRERAVRTHLARDFDDGVVGKVRERSCVADVDYLYVTVVGC
jgi:hypothetical protein